MKHFEQSAVYQDLVAHNDDWYGVSQAEVEVLARPEFHEKYTEAFQHVGTVAGLTTVTLSTLRGDIDMEWYRPSSLGWRNGTNFHERGLSGEEIVQRRAEKTARLEAYYDRGLLRRGVQVARALLRMESDHPAVLPLGPRTPNVLLLEYDDTKPKQVFVDRQFEDRYRSIRPLWRIFV